MVAHVLSNGIKCTHTASTCACDLHASFDLHQFLLLPLIHVHLHATPERNEHVDGEVFHRLVSVDADVAGEV